ncbi:sulfite exporter TauE/SafE family protein [Desulfovibrio subterraneus]|uniref:sulfite exporter TauE/SafE family protein n=1 Tax=Desulfovibrio subterraneus TaxID=2718620 RepID=UPI0022B89145|nr:sulfite exporter TauE/SafE family protein [Desulfovibrio subterraneus]WBF66883.1 sulfite exporter TauE/SafE family protein [Desulfovibrio subterraneus]
MFKSKKTIMVLALTVLTVFLCMEPAWADRLQDAINAAPKGAEAGQINPESPLGFLSIPGAPDISLILGFGWAVWVGWIFSTVGAFGGIMAGVGHITIFGLGNYASGFKKTAPDLNKLITDSIRVSNQWLVGTSAGISSYNYYRMGRLVLPLALALGLGSIAGSTLVPWLTAGKISLKSYIGYFGLFVLFLGCYLLYETTPRGQASKKKAKEAAKAFESSIKGESKVDTSAMGVKVKSFSPSNCTFTFYGVEFSFNPVIPLVGGFFIAAMASFLGVGGGFLLVPFLTSVAGLPMYLVAGTSALAVLIGMITSIFTYMFVSGTPIFWPLIGAELVGIFVGSVIGPRTSKYIPEIWLKRIFIVLAFYVGIRYASKGLFDLNLLPPY